MLQLKSNEYEESSITFSYLICQPPFGRCAVRCSAWNMIAEIMVDNLNNSAASWVHIQWSVFISGPEWIMCAFAVLFYDALEYLRYFRVAVSPSKNQIASTMPLSMCKWFLKPIRKTNEIVFYRNEREWFTQQLKTKAVHSQFELESDSHFSWARQHFQFILMFWGKFNISAKTFLQKRNVELLKLWKMLWKSSWRFGFNYKSSAAMRVC